MRSYDLLTHFRTDLMTIVVPADLVDWRNAIVVLNDFQALQDFVFAVHDRRDDEAVSRDLKEAVAGGLEVIDRFRFLDMGKNGEALVMRAEIIASLT